MVRPGVLACVLAAFAALALAPTPAPAADLPRAIGMYPASGPALAMVDSKVEVTVRGPIAEVIVTQRFHEPRRSRDRGDLRLPAAGRRRGHRDVDPDRHAHDPRRRSSAATTRSAATRPRSAQGVGAGLLDQERPDVFTQTVAAIPARGTVEVTLRYDTLARYEGGTWELVLPMVVAPRYVPGAATSRPTTAPAARPTPIARPMPRA